MRQKITVIFKQESLKNHTVKRLKHGTYEWEKALLSPPPLLQLGIPIYVRPYKKPEERICPICKKDVEDEIPFLTLCPAYQEKRSTLFEYLNKDYRISVNRMAPDDVFLLLINPPSENKPVQKLIAKHVFDCYEKRRSLVL